MCRIFICTTCNRYAPPRADETSPGLRLAQTVKAAAAADKTIAVRMVECLNTCPNPCAAAFREPGKAVIRFGGLEPGDTSALLAAATTYAQSTDGILSPNTLPERLRSKIAGCITLGIPELARR